MPPGQATSPTLDVAWWRRPGARPATACSTAGWRGPAPRGIPSPRAGQPHLPSVRALPDHRPPPYATGVPVGAYGTAEPDDFGQAAYTLVRNPRRCLIIRVGAAC